MKTNKIRLTESQLREMIAEAVKEAYHVFSSGMAGYINPDKDGEGDAVDASFRIGNNKPFSDSKLYRYSGKGKKNGNTFLNALKHNGGIKNFMKHDNRYINDDDIWTDNDAYGVNIYDGDYVDESKNKIRLTESQLRNMIAESIKEAYDMDRVNRWAQRNGYEMNGNTLSNGEEDMRFTDDGEFSSSSENFPASEFEDYMNGSPTSNDELLRYISSKFSNDYRFTQAIAEDDENAMQYLANDMAEDMDCTPEEAMKALHEFANEYHYYNPSYEEDELNERKVRDVPNKRFKKMDGTKMQGMLEPIYLQKLVERGIHGEYAIEKLMEVCPNLKIYGKDRIRCLLIKNEQFNKTYGKIMYDAVMKQYESKSPWFSLK